MGIPRPKSLVEKAAEKFETTSPGLPAERNELAALPPAGEAKTLGDGQEHSTSTRPADRFVILDPDRLRISGCLVPGEPSVAAEEFRMIKRPLLKQAFAAVGAGVNKNRLILVTSAEPGEGKTFVAANLAISMASERDILVLLVDADVVKPSVPSLFGFAAEKGLIDLVEDKALDLADVLVRTSIENLSILPAGHHSPVATELLASARMADVVGDIAGRFENGIIIFDSPPLLVRSEPNVLATHAGQIVLVVEADRTPQDHVRQALHFFDENKITGLVLNKRKPLFSRGEALYYYYYHKMN